jgi:O-antigen ligase
VKISAAFLVAFLHLYSVRSGLLALYAIVVVEIARYMFRKKAYARGLLSLLILASCLVAALSLSPTLRNKIENTKVDLQVYAQGSDPNHSSISTRFISYKIAMGIFLDNVFIGCGLGDIADETTRHFEQEYPSISVPIIPHNQFIFYLAATGISGTVLFCLTFFYPLIYRRNFTNPLLLMHFLVLFLSFQTEPMIETQLGVGYTLLFLLLPLSDERLATTGQV